jgi:hypothetical protein
MPLKSNAAATPEAAEDAAAKAMFIRGTPADVLG